MTKVLIDIAALAATVAPIRAQAPGPRPAVPIEPIGAILDAFRSHPVVALGDNHAIEQGHAFRLSLIRDARFAATVNDIVVEFGNARYQDVMDRFVRGEEVPPDSLRRAWQNATQPDTLWDVPIYEEFFRAVRAVNASLPRERRLRVLLGDPPIDWDSVHTAADYGSWDRDGHPADLIRREVLVRGRRALLIYGDLHFVRRSPLANPASEDRARSIVGLLEASGTRVFSVHTETRVDLNRLQPGVDSWPKPSLAILRGTALGAADFASYYPRPLMIGSDGKPLPDRRRPMRMEDQLDALLYLGPPSGMMMASLSPALCSDPAYLEMRLRRTALLPLPPNGAASPVDRLKQHCAALPRK